MLITMDGNLTVVVRVTLFTSTIYSLGSGYLAFRLLQMVICVSIWSFSCESAIEMRTSANPSCVIQWCLILKKEDQTKDFDDFNLEQVAPNGIRRGASSSRSQKKVVDNTGLPDNMIEEILSFLDFRKLVQCGIIAKQFRYCYKYGKRLDFDLSFRRTLRDINQYESIVSQIMDQHDGCKIMSLKLCFTPVNNLDNQAIVAQWINKAFQKEVEELELNFDHSLEPFRVAFDLICHIKTLEALHLVFVDIGSPTKDFQVTGLGFLKICSMKRVHIKEVILDALLKSCTELETLEIIQCNTPHHVTFSAENLNKFKKLRLAKCTNLREITLDVPSLITLHYSGQLIAFHFENCGNFVDFLLDLKSSRWSVIYANHFLLGNLMLNLPRIEVMTTTSLLPERMWMKFVEAGTWDMLYSFQTVKEINLTLRQSRRCGLFTIVYFLGKFPRCERLFIDVRNWLEDMPPTSFQIYVRRVFAEANGGSVRDHPLVQEEQQPPPEWTTSHTALANQGLASSFPQLRQLKLTGFRFEPDEMELLCYLLRNGHNLQTVAIFPASPRHWRSTVPDEVVFNHNLRPIITSSNLWIRIFQHKQEKEFYPAKHPKDWQKC